MHLVLGGENDLEFRSRVNGYLPVLAEFKVSAIVNKFLDCDRVWNLAGEKQGSHVEESVIDDRVSLDSSVIHNNVIYCPTDYVMVHYDHVWHHNVSTTTWSNNVDLSTL